MKKLMIIAVVIVVIFSALALITSAQNKQQSEGNPFGKSTLHPETIKQLDDPNYQNIILPEELYSALKLEEDIMVYFYSPTCEYCNLATPQIVSVAEELGTEVKMFNLLEFEQGWEEYKIDGTPTLVHFETGREIARVSGLREKEAYKSFLGNN
ncbi:thioredoxin family protein [Evansella sp. LMS18]|jgi:thioredoxin-related protein|uniref:thioredoxin family protein n=1 Tax=Evansella sp. LMS18 TaxID=2924033 RepID=UPI0020D11426|nr:thioredoxin family protein [Evansella sp. LMS18]UTR11203.1 thioredoxin family protein [Evansella sp. LMS18]